MRAAILLLTRDWRGKELGLLLAAITLATATITCIQLFSDRIQRSLLNEASTFLAGDALIRSSQPFDAKLLEQAKALNIQTAITTGFRAMVFNAADDASITAVKAVDENYPLKGQLIIDQGGNQTVSTNRPPNSGEVWLAPRLLNQLSIERGDTVYIGQAQFIVKAAILKEPDSAQSMVGLAPRALIASADIKSTQAVQQGSRIDYRLTLSGDEKNISAFKRVVESSKNPHLRWQDIRTANRNLGSALDRAESFLMLTGSLGVVLCGLAIALGARRYATRQIAHVAMLKTFGLTPQKINQLYVLNFILLGVGGALVGVMVGYALHFLIVMALAALLTVSLSAPSILPFLFSGVAGFIIFLGFALAPILKLKDVSPAAALHFDENNNLAFGHMTWLIGFITTLLFIFIYSQSLLLTIILLAALVCCGAGVALCNVTIIGFMPRLFNPLYNIKWLTKKGVLSTASKAGMRLGVKNLSRHKVTNSLQIFVFSTLLMLLFTLTLVRTQLIDQWQRQVPAGTPNHFLFNIFEQDKTYIAAVFNNENIDHTPFYPMTRGRLIEINDTPIQTVIQAHGNNNMGDNYERELNLTWAQTLGSDNTLLEGQWFDSPQIETSPDKNTVLLASIEQDYARGLGIQLGDMLRFSISGETVSAKVSSIRSVQWDSMNPNFYVIFNQPLLKGTASTALTSFYLPAQKKYIVNDLLKKIPSLSIIELDQILMQVQSIIQKVTRAVELLLMLVLSAGLLVLYSSVQASLDIRKQESAVIKTLGGNKKTIQIILLTEFILLGFISGLLATIGATVALYFIQTHFMGLTYEANIWLIVIGPLLSAILIGGVGWMSTRSVVNTTPMQILRAL